MSDDYEYAGDDSGLYIMEPHRDLLMLTERTKTLELERDELARTIKELSRNLKASNDEVMRLRDERDRLITELERERREKNC